MNSGMDKTNVNRRLRGVGPGGIKCQCCRKLELAEQKRVQRRKERRHGKVETAVLVSELA